MENWSAVPGATEYLVSDEGRVARLLRGAPSQKGDYLRVNIKYDDGKTRTRLVHHLVLEAFRTLRAPGQIARHLNDVGRDNRLSNLTWGTHRENLDDSFVNGGRTLKSTCPLGHPIEGKNLQRKGRRCKACNRARAHSHRTGVEMTKELADQKFEEVMR